MWRAFAESWADLHRDSDVRAAELLALAESCGLDLGRGDPGDKTRRLGVLLAAQQDGFFGGHRIERRSRVKGVLHWRVTTDRKTAPSAAKGGEGGVGSTSTYIDYSLENSDACGSNYLHTPHPSPPDQQFDGELGAPESTNGIGRKI